MSCSRPTRPRSASPLINIEPLEPRTLLSVQLVADLNATPGSGDPANAVQVNGVTLFAADDNAHGREVWRTDGTPAGTVLVKDIITGPTGSNPVLLGTAGNQAFFVVDGGGLWQTDGTSQNTYQLAATVGTYPPSPKTSAAVGDTFYCASISRLFSVRSGVVTEVPLVQSQSEFTKVVSSGSELYLKTYSGGIWVSDGTTEGSHPLPVASAASVTDLVSWNGTTYFSVTYLGMTRNELWKTQGTDGTTTLVATLPGAPISMTVSGDHLYFWAGKSTSTGEGTLWKSDGTAAGTVAVANVFLPSPSTSLLPILTPSAGKVFFADATDTSYTATPRLWVSDGTTAGTTIVSTAVTPRFPPGYDRLAMFDVNGTLFFPGADAEGGSELWKTDGTSTNTVRITDLVPGAADSAPQMLAAAGSRLLFSAATPQAGRELYATDGTPEGTALVDDLNTGTASTVVTDLAPINGKLVLSAGGRLYVVPGAASAPQPLTFDDPSVDAMSCKYLTKVGTQLFFRASVYGRNDTLLCVTDGTSAGTRVVKDLPTVYDPTNFTAAGDRLFFTWNGTLYTSDGTDEGTVALAGGLGFFSAGPVPDPSFAAVGGRLYFSAQTSTTGQYELWTSDGTPQGTARVVAFPSNTRAVTQLTPANGRLYFVGGDRKLYQTDGTATGTAVVGTGAYAPRGTAPDDSLLLASGTTGKLMRLGPTDAAPAPLADLVPATAPMVRMGKWVYFVASQDGSLGQVWRTDGTTAGTTLAADAAKAASLTPAGNLLYFTDTNAAVGRELYATDGTPGGTYLVADMIPGPGDPALGALRAVDNTLYFTALDGVHGRELWRAPADLPGDANRDRVVNFNDLLILASNYNKTGATWAQGDFDGDGIVNFNDLLILARNYNATLPALSTILAPAAAPPVDSPPVLSARAKPKSKPVFRVAATPPRRPALPSRTTRKVLHSRG